MRTYIFLALSFISPVVFAQTNSNKTAVIAFVEKQQQELINLSDSIWKYA